MCFQHRRLSSTQLSQSARRLDCIGRAVDIRCRKPRTASIPLHPGEIHIIGWISQLPKKRLDFGSTFNSRVSWRNHIGAVFAKRQRLSFFTARLLLVIEYMFASGRMANLSYKRHTYCRPRQDFQITWKGSSESSRRKSLQHALPNAFEPACTRLCEHVCVQPNLMRRARDYNCKVEHKVRQTAPSWVCTFVMHRHLHPLIKPINNPDPWSFERYSIYYQLVL